MEYSRKQRLTLAVAPALAAAVIRLLGATWRYRDVYAPGPDGQPTPLGIGIPGPVIFAFWHSILLMAAHRFRHKDIAILISPSFDGELIARTAERLGFMAVRGSSSRGGAAALRGMTQAYIDRHRCAFTADGPRGPAHVAKPGPVHIAELTGATWLGAFHAHPASAWRLRSWDGFLIPKPFTTVTFTWPPHSVPTIEALQQSLDQAMSMATENSSPTTDN